MDQGNGREVTLSDATNRALAFAGLKPEALRLGPHPDTGESSWVLDATIQQYSGFLAALTAQFRMASRMAPIIDSVQIENRTDGDTLFWISDFGVLV